MRTHLLRLSGPLLAAVVFLLLRHIGTQPAAIPAIVFTWRAIWWISEGNPKLLIVDEPTAGLDPAERNRFYNLLSEIGETTIVILSTHIVEDVQTLCKRFAIICGGEVMYVGTPKEAIQMMEGKVWAKSIPRQDVDTYRAEYRVIATNLSEGMLFIRIASDEDPGNGFTPVKPTLEDVYFRAISEKMDLVTL